jgi:hypothetical protein
LLQQQFGDGAPYRTDAACRAGDQNGICHVFSPTSVRVSHCARHCERHCLGLSGEDFVIGGNQLDQHLVPARRRPCQVDCIAITRVRPPPGQVIDVYVQMPDCGKRFDGLVHSDLLLSRLGFFHLL